MQKVALVAAAGLFLFQPLNTTAAQEFNRPESNQFLQERSIIETILASVVDLVENAAHLSTGDGTRLRLLDMSDRLTGNASSLVSAQYSDADSSLVDLEEKVREALAEIQAVRSDLTRKGDIATSKRLESVEDLLSEALDTIQKSEGKSLGSTSERQSADEWLKPGVYDSSNTFVYREPTSGNETSVDYSGAEIDEDESWDNWRNNHRWDDYDRYDFLKTYVGEFTYRWPFRETAVYRTTPAIRYNRVEGLVLGFRRMPLEWDSYERGRIYGSGGYAFGSDRWQYELGAEGRIGKRYGGDDIDLKFGGSYRRATYTNDLWKSTWAENSLAAFFFNYDFFDYYETEGWTGYATARLTPFSQFTVAYRDEDYSSLEREISWSLFGGDNFRFNAPIDSGRVQSVVVAVEGGEVKGLHHLPHGVAFRGEAELGSGMGGDFSFNRYTADLRTYVRATRRSSLGMRIRGGYADGDMLPVQKGFTIGGIGSVRAHAQNAYYGSRVVIFNAEYAVVQGWLWDELLIAGFVDAGWTNAGSNEFAVGDMIKTAGVGFGLYDRAVRLDLAFPLDNISGDKDPTLWLRITPSF